MCFSDIRLSLTISPKGFSTIESLIARTHWSRSSLLSAANLERKIGWYWQPQHLKRCWNEQKRCHTWSVYGSPARLRLASPSWRSWSCRCFRLHWRSQTHSPLSFWRSAAHSPFPVEWSLEVSSRSYFKRGHWMLLFLASRQSIKLIVSQREMKKSALVKEIVEASIVENKPTSLPGSPLAALIFKIQWFLNLNGIL